MNPFDFPSDPFALRGKLFALDLDDRIDASLHFITDEYPQKDRLYQCQQFFDYVYTDCFRGSLKEWDKHFGFPSTEASHQFDYAIKHALAGSYQAAFGHLRCSLELTLLSVYFSFEKHFLDGEDWLNLADLDWAKAKKDERKWFDSLADTPFFSTMIKVIRRDERFDTFDSTYSWIELLKTNYYKLSDHTHVKGYKMGTQAMNEVRAHFNSSSFHSISINSLTLFLDVLIATVENIVLLIALYNPIVLAELPLEEKFGINEPIGFIHPGQSRALTALIPAAFMPFFEKLRNEDQEIIDVVNWVDSQPTMSDEQLQQQFKDFNNTFSDNNH